MGLPSWTINAIGHRPSLLILRLHRGGARILQPSYDEMALSSSYDAAKAL